MLPGPQGQPEEDQRLGRSHPARRQGHHPQPQDQRRRALELSRGLGLRAEEIRHARRKAKLFLAKLFRNVPVLDFGARGSTTTFVERGQGDVLLAWENEALLACNETGTGQIRHRHPVGLDPGRAAGRGGRQESSTRRGTRAVAEAYLKYLYTPEAQEIIARNYYRPRNAQVAAKYKGQFRRLPLLTIERNFGGWNRAQAPHFNDGGLFDQIFEAAKR